MRSVKTFVVAGAASLMFSSLASAADMAIAGPPMSYGPPPVAAADFGGWYLRGDVGFSNTKVDSVRNTNAALYTGLNSFQQTTGFDSGGLYQLGAGYKFNSWFRADVTGEYRGGANFHGLDLISFNNGGTTGFGSDKYDASHSGWLFLANVYADLGTWYCITPYIGAGVGTAQVKVANFTDSGVATLFPAGSGVGPSMVSAATGSQWNFAWALHAGLSYQVTQNMSVDLGYSYVNMGSGATGIDSAFDGSAGGHVFQYHNITSQDVKLGVRWNLWNPPAYAPPLVTKG
jgi:opacity protein-like surface antigen